MAAEGLSLSSRFSIWAAPAFLLCGLAVQAGSLSERVRMATIAKLF